MKTNRNAITILLTLVLVTAFAGFAAAQGYGMMGHMGAITPEKQATMQKLHEEYYTATADLQKQLFAKNAELDAQLYGDKTDDAKVEALTAEINALNAKIFTERIKLNKAMAKEGIMPMGGRGMMNNCPNAGGGMMGGKGMHRGMMHGMQYDRPDADDTTMPHMNHNMHAPAQQ